MITQVLACVVLGCSLIFLSTDAWDVDRAVAEVLAALAAILGFVASVTLSILVLIGGQP